MEIRQLKTFRAVAQTRSFTKASQILDYVQSNVTAQIQTLEKDLGVRLFDRLGRQVTLTEAGERLLPYADQIMHLLDEAERAVSARQSPQGQIRIGASESVCSYRLPAILQAMRQQHPQVKPAFWPGPMADLVPRVRQRELDVALILDAPVQGSDTLAYRLGTEPITLVCAPEHPLAQMPTLDLHALAKTPMLATEPGCAYRAIFEQTLAELGIRQGDILEFRSVEAIKQCVIAGMGFAVLPQMVVRREIAQGQLVTLPWIIAPFVLELQLICHADTWLPNTVQSFIAVAQSLTWA